MSNYDVVVIGAGPGGYVAAIRAAQLGKKVAIIEKEHLGGVCLNWGCIPTKALLRSAEIKHLIDHAADFGLEVGPVKIDLKKIVERSRKISSQLSAGIAGLMKKNKIDTIMGHARFTNSQTLSVTTSDGKTQTVNAKHTIVATGARSRELPHLKADGKRIWVARHAMVPEFMPKSLLVIGSGAIGIEFASFYQTLGCKVTVIEMQNRILPVEDAEISKIAQKNFETQGMTFHLNSTVENLVNKGNTVEATLKIDGKAATRATFDAAIIAIGIVGNTDDLGLEKTKVKTDKGQITVNGTLQTDDPAIYAIGDVAGAPWLAHKASHEGIMAAEKIAGMPVHALKKESVPGCTYSMPQVASIGLTEDKAKELYKDIKVGRFPFKANGKALALGEPEGLVKTIFDAKTGELLGAHMIGAEVTELIQGFVIAKSLETTEAELMHTVFPHPTLSEMMHESVLNAYGRTIHF